LRPQHSKLHTGLCEIRAKYFDEFFSHRGPNGLFLTNWFGCDAAISDWPRQCDDVPIDEAALSFLQDALGRFMREYGDGHFTL
jgi:hypothetical protein